MRKLMLLVLGCCLAVALLIVSQPMSRVEADDRVQGEVGDPVLDHPGFQVFAERYPGDWESRVDPSIRPIIDWQRKIGSRALVVGWSNEEANPRYQDPRVVVYVVDWDGSDLFQAGLEKELYGKPVVIQDIKEIPKAASLCDKMRPVLGGLANENRDQAVGTSTIGGAVFGHGWPTNAGWKYALGSQHGMASVSGNLAGDDIVQPPVGCAGSARIGDLTYIPLHLRGSKVR